MRAEAASRPVVSTSMTTASSKMSGVALVAAAIDHRETDAGERLQTCSLVRLRGTQHAFDHLPHHRQPQRIGAPPRPFDRLVEFRFREQDLRIVPGARTGILVDALLHEEGGVV